MAVRHGARGSMVTTRAVRLISLAVFFATTEANTQCGGESRMHALDFWLGHWDVASKGELVGKNVIATILDACAVTEKWMAVNGHAGFSLFYYDRNSDRWKQVWVSDRAFTTGGTKEKTEIRELTTESEIRFEGRYEGEESGSLIFDRTTLTRNADGSVRQLIEVSTDEGRVWKTVFDGHYKPHVRSSRTPAG